MKTIYRYLIAFMAALAFATFAKAQDYNEQNGIALAKRVDGPNAQGQYTITLEAFTTGTVSISSGTAPADIVLVLDYSSSMNGTKIASLRSAVKNFITTIKNSNSNVIADDNGKHRIALVLYSTNVYTGTGLNSLISASDVNPNVLDSNNPSTGTYSGRAMQRALAIIQQESNAGHYTDSELHQNSKRSRIVVFFTDGDPSSSSEGLNCIVAANSIKNNYGGVVYSVGLFTSTSTTAPTRQSTYLKYTSSDYNDKTVYPPSRNDGTWEMVSEKYSFLVDKEDKLNNVFSSIAETEGQSGAELGSTSTVTVDVVSASFTLPEGADKSSIKTYTAKCIGAATDEDGNYITFTDTDGKEKIKEFLFDTKVPTAGSALFNGVEVDDSEFDDNIISTKGFDYQKYYCAAEQNNGEYTGNFDGYKLVIEIPIIINPKSVGGPNTDTNDPQSGVYITDEQGHRLPTPAASFNRPTLPIPVNLVVRKYNMYKGESAKFIVERANAYDSDGKLIKVVQANPKAGEIAWSTFEENATWTPLMTFVLTGDGTSTYDEFSATGLSDRYYYRIVEEGWSWSYTSEALTSTNTYLQKTNPFEFSNSKGETTRKHAESIVTNIFEAGVDPVTVDSREFFGGSSSANSSKRK